MIRMESSRYQPKMNENAPFHLQCNGEVMNYDPSELHENPSSLAHITSIETKIGGKVRNVRGARCEV